MLLAALIGCEAPDALPAAATPPVDAVDPFIGTGGPGFRVGSMTPAAKLPFGMVTVGPDSSLEWGALPAYHCSGYYYDDTHIDGFSLFHLVGVGVADYGNVLFMPMDGWDASRTSPDAWRQTFSHDEEEAAPGRYAVTLDDGIRVELAATNHAAHQRYTWPDDVTDPVLVIDLEHALGNTAIGAEVHVDADAGSLSGWTWDAGSFVGGHGGYKLYFYAEIDGGVASFGTWADDTGVDGRADAEGVDVGVWLRPSTTRAEVRVGISLVSVDAARANLAAELPPRDLDGTASLATRAWEDALGIVEVEGGTEEERTLFYTALYHALAMPTEHGDADGAYRGFDQEVHQADGFTYHSDMSMWDTYRTAHPLYTLLYPEKSRDFATSLLRMAEQGGAFPRWPAAGGEGGSMLGSPQEIVLADTWLKGVRDWDMEAAWPRMRAQARGEGEIPYNARPDVATLEAYGYYPADLFGTSVAWLQELTWADHAMALLAGDLGEPAEAAHFAWRSYFWQNVWDEDVGWFHARHADGTFADDYDPDVWLDEYAEGNGWQYLWMPFPHHAALGETLGGREAALARLDGMFELSEAEGLLAGPQTYYWHGNEPDIHAPWLFALWGDPDAGLKWQRWIREELYAAAPDGLAGNDDGGTLSSWYIFSALGFFPIAGTPEYVVGVPLFERATFPAGDGTFTVRRVGDGDHVAGVTLNGVPLPDPTFRHAQIVAGGELVVELE